MRLFAWLAGLFGGRKAMTEDATTGETAAELATEFEGFRPAPYWDASGRVWSIGYGSTHEGDGRPVTAATPAIDKATGLLWLGNDMRFALQDIAEVVRVQLTDNQRAAIEDFIYNVGTGNFNGSTLLRLLNSGQFEEAAAQFERWDHAGGVEMAGLLRRRQAEAALFLKPTEVMQNNGSVSV